jgi:hypothetical protein
MRTIEAWTIEMGKATETSYGGYQTAGAHAHQTDHRLLHGATNSPPVNADTQPNYQHHPQQELQPFVYCDELGHIC